MKQLFTIFLICCCNVFNLLGQCAPSDTFNLWYAYNKPQGLNMQEAEAIHMSDDKNIFAVGHTKVLISPDAYGRINQWSRSLDGGCTWTGGSIPVFDSLSANYFVSLSMPNDESIYVLCKYTRYDSIQKAHYTSSGVFHSTDSGVNWRRTLPYSAFPGVGGYANFIHFFDDKEGIIGGDISDGYFEFYQTKDAGLTWKRLPRSSFPVLTGWDGFLYGHCAQGDTIWCATAKGNIYRSVDRGTNWTYSKVGAPTVSYKIDQNFYFKDARNGLYYFGGNGWRTKDGGATWTPVSTPLENGNHKISGIPGTDWYLSYQGSEFTISTDGEDWTILNYWDENVAIHNRWAFLDKRTACNITLNNFYKWRPNEILNTEFLSDWAVSTLRQLPSITEKIHLIGLEKEININTDFEVTQDSTSIRLDSRKTILPRAQKITDTFQMDLSAKGHYVVDYKVRQENGATLYEKKHHYVVTDTILAKGMPISGKFTPFSWIQESLTATGTEMEIRQTDTLTGLSAWYMGSLSDSFQNCRVRYSVYGFSSGSSVPNKLLYTSPFRTITGLDVNSWVYQKLPNPLALVPGKYVLMLTVIPPDQHKRYWGSSRYQRDHNAWAKGGTILSPWKNEKGCLVLRAHFNPIKQTTPSKPDPLQLSVKCSPNPTEGMLYISGSFDQVESLQVQILDMAGLVLMSKPMNQLEGKSTEPLDLSAFPSGLYLLKILGDRFSYVEKIMKI